MGSYTIKINLFCAVGVLPVVAGCAVVGDVDDSVRQR